MPRPKYTLLGHLIGHLLAIFMGGHGSTLAWLVALLALVACDRLLTLAVVTGEGKE